MKDELRNLEIAYQVCDRAVSKLTNLDRNDVGEKEYQQWLKKQYEITKRMEELVLSIII
jgi:hypothetical protein